MSLLVESSRGRRVLTLGLPIVGGMVSQNILNLVDTAMVGHLGSAALAAVGAGSFANFMAVSFVTGFSSGVQAMASRRKGEGRDHEAAVPLNGGLLLATAIAVPVSVIVWLLVPILFPILNGAPEVIEQGVPYLQARVLAMAAVGMNFAFRGYWNAIDRSALYLRTLLVMHAANIFLNWVLIYGRLGSPAYGAAGAGMASAIATYIGTGYYFYLGLRHARGSGFLAGLPGRDTLGTMIRLSVPMGVQQLFFSAGYTALFWIFGQIGVEAAGAAHVLIQVMLVAILPGIALGIAAASLVGQALGRGDPDDAKRWGWDVVKVGIGVLGALGLLMVALPDPILMPFMPDAELRAVARPVLRLIGATIALDAVGLVLQNALTGAGAARSVMTVSIALQWGLFLPAAYIVGPYLGGGLFEVWVAQAVYRGVQSLVFAAIWRSGAWASIRV